ncbi:MAG: DNA cytosine methyltransferase [Cytophagia bacterium]|nr:DNA cytosine methyltransferase [Cytophagia bacterium]
MKVLELFAGSRSIGKVCDELGHEVFSSDWTPFDGIDYAVDINEFDTSKVPFIPDMIWASPPCTTFSVASIGKHWDINRRPKTEDALMGLQILKKTIALIDHFRTLNPHLIWYIENPRGMMRRMDAFNILPHIRQTVTYCQYGDTRMKPTDIWTNNYDWNPRPACKNGMSCHISAPRGSRTGTQGLKGSYVRSQIPYELCKEIVLNSSK